MKIEPADIEIETLVRRIERNELDLQPDFQRGEVWSLAKRQRLIDSILRRWHIPPIHILEGGVDGVEVVLDGQQRLAAIRDFTRDGFAVDGTIKPIEPRIAGLDGKRYSQLPNDVQLQFSRFPIRQLRLRDYAPEEPAELFYRLNQPVSLTTAEQRNAFFGAARSQVRELAEFLDQDGSGKQRVGFSNSRMAYDDVLARLCIATERRSILKKITAIDLADRYRSGEAFSERTMYLAREAISTLVTAATPPIEALRLNKATMFSWLWFLVAAQEWNVEAVRPATVRRMAREFSALRDHAIPPAADNLGDERARALNACVALSHVYDDRATARVADVSSVVARDMALWSFFVVLVVPPEASEVVSNPRLARLARYLDTLGGNVGQADSFVEHVSSNAMWGQL